MIGEADNENDQSLSTIMKSSFEDNFNQVGEQPSFTTMPADINAITEVIQDTAKHN